MLKSISNKAIMYLIYGLFLFLPIKLSFSLVFLIPLILIYLLRDFEFKDLFKDSNKYLTYFFIFAFLFSFCTIAPLKSMGGLVSFYFYILLIPAVSKYTKKSDIPFLVSLLVLGQSVASFHTIFQEAFGDKVIRDFFVGKLSESGQLALTFSLVLGILFINEKGLKFKDFIYSLLLLTVSLCLGFSNLYFKDLTIVFLIGFLVLIIYPLFVLVRSKDITNIKNYILFYMPLCLSSLILNLKRGPWLGILCVLIVLIFKFNRKIFVPIFILCVVSIFCITPIRERVLSSENHFFISGGRASIWRVALEHTTRYPLGVGYKSSRNLSSYSVDIPSNLRHFHNNFLNILVEFGIFNLFLYLIWLVLLLKKAFKGDNVAFILGLAVLSNQIAGIVEYNIGDSEVFLILLTIVGMIENLRGENLGTK